MAKPKLDNNTVYLIDGSGYIFRAYFAVRGLTNKSGVPTNAVYGFTNMLLKLLREHKPKLLAIAFDRKEPTFRHQIYSLYKGNRPPPPQDLIPQFELIHKVVDAFMIKRLEMPGFEADDLIATMARKAQSAGHEVVIVTGDKDFMQLVDKDTFLLDELRASRNGAELFIDEQAVFAELGVEPKNVIDLLALAGDASDNVPGVAGIGAKTAAELINEFGNVEKILEMVPLIKQKGRREKLIEGHKLALISKKLVTIDRFVPLDLEVDGMHYSGVNQEQLKSLFIELDFNRLLQDKELFKEPSIKEQPKENIYQEINTEIDFDNWLNSIKDISKLSLYCHSDSPDAMKAELLGLAFAYLPTKAVYISWQVIKNSVKIFDQIKYLLKTKKIIAIDAKFHRKLLCRMGFDGFKVAGDPMLASYLLMQDQERHDIISLSNKYLNLSIALLRPALAADITLQLEEILAKELSTQSLSELYYLLELPIEEVLCRMELYGVLVDTKKLEELHEEFNARLLALESIIYEMAGAKINLASPKQVQELLFERLKLPMIKKTKTGSSTDSFVLEKLAELHDIPKILLEHRVLAKLISTYVATLPNLINNFSGRIHTNYNQFVTATGRLSSSDPNLQNIPIRTKEGRRCREAFIAKPGFVLISLDYSQVELRLLAHVSQDPVLLDSFAKDQDVHQRTAAEIFELSPELITKEHRAIAKTINFGLLYGMGAHRLAQSLNISRSDAQSYLKKYFEKYAGIVSWKAKIIEEAMKSGEVRTLFGRLRKVPDLQSKNAVILARGERLAINTPIQGTAADIIKKAMIDTDRLLATKYPESHLIMQVHDELVIEAKEEDAKAIAEEVAHIMSKEHGLKIDLKVEYGIGPNWEKAH